MLRHKKTLLKRLFATLFLGIFTFSLAITAMPAPKAAAAVPGSYTDVPEVRGAILDHQLYFMLQSCFFTKNMDLVTVDEVDDWRWFVGGDTTDPSGAGVDGTEGFRGGMYENPAVSCDNGQYIEEAFSRFGFEDPRDTFCSLSFTFSKKYGGLGNGGSKVDCLNGFDTDSGKSDGFDGRASGSDQQKALDKLLSSASNYSKAKGALTPYEEYVRMYRTLMVGCKVTLLKDYPSDSDPADGDRKLFKVPVVRNGSKVTYALGEAALVKSPVLVSTRDGSGQWEDCGYYAEQARKYAEDYRKYLERNNIDGTQATEQEVTEGGPVESGAIDTECAGFNLKEILSLNWVLCPLITMATKTVNGMENVIAGMLCINENEIFGAKATCSGESGSSGSSDAFHEAWSVFRILALGLLAIAGLVMIISQALGFEIFDAYTIKKTLPRILIAGVGISLSWQLLEALVTFSNALGIGVRALIYAPFLQSDMDDVVFKGGATAVAVIFGPPALVILGPLGLLSFIGTALLAVLIAFLVLIVRNILVILLILIAPLAIAAYILPNTEKYWKTWWDWLFKALLAFPIITALIAIGHVFAAVASERGSGTLNTIVAFFAYFAPYFLIPAAFRFAGGLMATLGGFVNDRSRGGFDRLKKFRADQVKKRGGYYARQYGDRAMQRRAEWSRNLNAAASKSDSRIARLGMRAASRQIAGLGGIEPRMSAINARTAKELNDQIATGNDQDIRGLTVNLKAIRSMGWDAAKEAGLVDDTTGVRRYKSLGGAWVNESDVLEGHRKWGKDVAAQQTALSYEMRKAMTDDDVAGISQRYIGLAKDQWNQTDTQAGGSWIGAAFENQNQHVEFKNTDLDFEKRTATLNAAKFSKELYEKKGSYQLSQMSAHTFKRMKEAYDVGDDATKQRIQAVAETFMQRGGAGGGVVTVDDQGQPIMQTGDPFQQNVQVQPQNASGQGNETDDEKKKKKFQSPAQYQTSSQGSGHVAEAVRDLAVHVGVYRPLDPVTDLHSAKPPNQNPRQN